MRFRNQQTALDRGPRAIWLTRRQMIAGGLVAGVVPTIANAKDSEAIAKEFVARHKIPGFSVAYQAAGTLRHVAAYGFADRAAPEPLRPDHRFRIASLSKPLTAAGVMLLVEAGALTLDSPVLGPDGILASLTPDMDTLAQPDWIAAITVDHLLSHRSGGWANAKNDPMFRLTNLNHADLIRSILKSDRLKTEPGSAYAYSNFGYCLLGRVIEAVSGQSYGDYMQTHVFGPAGVASFALAGDKRADRKPDEVIYKSERDDPYGMKVARMDAHGGWIATPTDMAMMMAAMDGFRAVPDILSWDSVEAMAHPARVGDGYGRGLAISPNHGNRWHTGKLPGVVTVAVMIEGGATMAGFVNVDRPGLEDALDEVMWKIHDAVMG
jgi:CubicO group peptidase (beta-lactamase class C family)